MKRMIYLASFVLLGSCASGARDSNAPQASLNIRVHNNLTPPATVEIFLVPASGIERQLGQAFSSRTSDFRYRGLAPQGQYWLVARAIDSRSMTSNPMILDGVLALEWHLNVNRVTITQTRND